MLTVQRVEYLKEYSLLLKFSDGSERIVDLEKELYGEVFEPLKAKQSFAQVYVNNDTGTIEWFNGADFAPEFLYTISKSS
ncbi:MAG TPA: DUF2442 domain-containing protein [Candidatus Kapabacteria bacterium]|nr:DUF2442 domain-containing protein [Candidatus Kapabacteria bacterium]